MIQQGSSRTMPGEAPIYDRLVSERGDVPAEVNSAAARLLRETERAVDFTFLKLTIIVDT
ncbi:hypothetical protein ACH41H_48175 [Streptomyces sp. NPDC020800]|uniref:hypothetical protein n=1 Tax=Streptomyces sp. NPDC020800 TaxID=3365092 RepID=UPI0037AD29B1